MPVKFIRIWLVVLACGTTPAARPVYGQIPEPSPATARLESHAKKVELMESSLLKNVEFRSIGPTVMSGRIVDLDVSPYDPTHFFVAYASGGLWKSTSNGTDFESLFDHQAVMTIGDVAVDWGEPETVFVGTGENNSSRSSYSGTGLYRSDNGGRDWEHIGLGETHHIGRILLDPGDAGTIFVAAIGHLYSKNAERGVFKSDDGGDTWRKTLFIDDSTGVIDLVMHPDSSSILYAAAWHRQRMAWDFVEGGDTSGIYRSADGGETWRLVTTSTSGFPTGQGVGRIGLAVTPAQPDVVYAVVDNQNLREEPDEDAPALTFEALEQMSGDQFREEVSTGDLEEYLEYYDFPDAYDADSVLTLVDSGEIEPADLVTYLGDANRALFESPVIGCEVYRSVDGGSTWSRTHDEELDDTCHTYGYYFGQIRVSPHDANEVYVAGVPLLKSTDSGKTWEDIGRENVHVDHHALWLNPERPGHLINGNDGGLNISYNGGETWLKLNSPTVGQFYTVAYDSDDPYNVYGGLQDNGVWVGPSNYEASSAWHGEGIYPYQRLLGGDGMMIEVDPRDSGLVYAGYQFGYYFRINRWDDERTGIRPEHELGADPFRFNWLTPIDLSAHNPDILYLGSNVVHRSMDQGENWTEISPDLTGGAVEGNVPFGTLTALAESELRFGLIYAGSDDGLIHLSEDGGASWSRRDDGLPERLWISRLEPSRHEESRVYVALNGYRWDHFEPYVFVSNDYGVTWDRVGTDLPLGPVNVVREDPHNPDVVYVGSDRGLFASIDAGESFSELGSQMPAAPVHDLQIQPRERELIAATHGRSLYAADVSHVERLTEPVLASPLFVFASDSVEYDETWGDRPANWEDPAVTEIEIALFSQSPGSGRIRILDAYDIAMSELEFEADRGLNFIEYDLSTSPAALEQHLERVADEEDGKETDAGESDDEIEPKDNGMVYLRPGSYEVEVELDGERERVPLIVYE